MARIKDLTGKIFGDFIVVNFVAKVKTQSLWKLKCVKCNHEKNSLALNFKRRKSKCLNCQYNYLIGQKFDRLKVLDIIRIGKFLKAKCICDCGNEKICPIRDLNRLKFRSCGCLFSEKLREHKRNRSYEHLFKLLKKGSFYRNLNCNLVYEEFLEFIKIGQCHYCEDKINWQEYPIKQISGPYYLDRKNNNLGYSKDNCVVCCKVCNKVKSNYFTYNQMIIIGKSIKIARALNNE